ncbi:MAG: Mth938-like domain-containing protein [Sedimentisphaerales bacterium]|nr:Mth938-like domain-containing protein [Sedimentisphaerales bacterium]
MRIDSYQFRVIIVDGVTYTSDCLLFGETVHSNWRRKQGHQLCPEDLQPVVAAKPSVLVVGCGAYGMMKIAKELPQFLQGHHIAIEAFDTNKAIERYNELSQTGENVAAALHLTC